MSYSIVEGVSQATRPFGFVNCNCCLFSTTKRDLGLELVCACNVSMNVFVFLFLFVIVLLVVFFFVCLYNCLLDTVTWAEGRVPGVVPRLQTEYRLKECRAWSWLTAMIAEATSQRHTRGLARRQTSQESLEADGLRLTDQQRVDATASSFRAAWQCCETDRLSGRSKLAGDPQVIIKPSPPPNNPKS